MSVASAVALVGVAAAIAHATQRDAGDRPAVAASSTSTAAIDGSTTTTGATTTSPTPQPTSSPTPTPTSQTTRSSSTTAGPPFESKVSTVSAAQLGASWRDGCPVPPEQLRALDLTYWGYDGAAHSGRVIVHEAYAERIVAVLRDVYVARFPIERMTPIDAYGGDDQASMRANNTSGFNCRYVTGTTNWSEHAFGRAIDVNPLVNPYVKGSSVDPPEGAPYADRRRSDAGIIHGGDAVVRAFAAQGWRWGGYWSSGKDYQHFSSSGR